MTYFYIDSQNQPVGPVTWDDLKKMRQGGSLRSDVLVVPVGGSEWLPISAFDGQNAAIPPADLLPRTAAAAKRTRRGATQAMGAATDALAAFKLFATNPVGRMGEAGKSLGSSRAMGAGMVYGAAFVLVLMLGAHRLVSSFMASAGGNADYGTPTGQVQIGPVIYMKFLLATLIPFAGLVGTNAAMRKVFKAEGSLGLDIFIAGAALLPTALVAVAGLILGVSGAGMVIIYTLSIYALCLTIMILFGGLTQICKTSVQATTFIVPTELLAVSVMSGAVFGMLTKN